MRRQLDLFLRAVRFLTRVPVPALGEYDPGWMRAGAIWFPVVGQLVGAVSAAILWFSAGLWTAPIPALLAVAAAVLLTGALHEDGLADTADGLGGGHHPAQRLLIMKDSRIGTFGSLALLLVLMLRVAALSSLAPRCAVLALVAGHGLARAACVVMMAATPYAGDPDIAKWHPRLARVSPGTVILSLALAAWLLLLMPAPSAACGLLAAALPALFVARSAVRLIGGHTGDILGAIEQMAETGFLLGVAAAKCG